jgi:hypothetical protein
MKAKPQVDLIGPECRYVEILTDAGIVRVNVGLVTVQEGKPSVVVEIEPNIGYQNRTAHGGEWTTEVRNVGTRTDVSLTRQDVPAETQS